MWRPNQLSIDLMMDELLKQSIRKSIQYSPYLKSWLNPEDMRRDVRSRLTCWHQNDIHDAYQMAAQVRRTVISYHRNAYEFHNLTSQVEVLQKQVENLESKLDRPKQAVILVGYQPLPKSNYPKKPRRRPGRVYIPLRKSEYPLRPDHS